jgi:hypothetical protein
LTCGDMRLWCIHQTVLVLWAVALAREKAWVHSEKRNYFTRVIVTASLRDLDHDGWWSTYDENVRKLPRISFRGVY